MKNSITKSLFPALAAVAIAASPAIAQHQHRDGDQQHQGHQGKQKSEDSMDMHGHHMKDGMPHFMNEGEHAAAVEAALTAYAAAAAESSVEGMAGYVLQTDDFTIIEGSHPNWGWADYRDNHLVPEFESEDIAIKSYAYDDFRISATPMIAYATFKVSIEATVRGEDMERERMGTAILVRTPDGWRIRHLHTS